jgi:hypothetical protein
MTQSVQEVLLLILSDYMVKDIDNYMSLYTNKYQPVWKWVNFKNKTFRSFNRPAKIEYLAHKTNIKKSSILYFFYDQYKVRKTIERFITGGYVEVYYDDQDRYMDIIEIKRDGTVNHEYFKNGTLYHTEDQYPDGTIRHKYVENNIVYHKETHQPNGIIVHKYIKNYFTYRKRTIYPDGTDKIENFTKTPWGLIND